MKSIKDVFGTAILDFQNGEKGIIKTHSSLAGWDELPVSYLFRSFDEMPEIEKIALKSSQGTVLDLGCGAGAHSVYLQSQGLDVFPVDISQGAVEACRKQGLNKAQVLNFWQIDQGGFDTILALMNGAGICGRLDKVPQMLTHLKSLLAPKGQIFLDSSDIIYMYEDENGEYDLSDMDHYYGEVTFNMKYKNEVSGPFPWLYLDFQNLKLQAENLNLNCECLVKGEHYDYLARITHKSEN
jgi:SAM-dependent methyltransferase